jgi:preprotein translocase subunit SecF
MDFLEIIIALILVFGFGVYPEIMITEKVRREKSDKEIRKFLIKCRLASIPFAVLAIIFTIRYLS